MTEDIDIKKLTNDAFMAIDALFTDEDDNMFSEEKEKEPDDFDLIQEYMLAIEWECSDKNIKKFADFLKKINPKYSGKHNQDILKMLMSIVRYLDKSKEKSLPETHQVMELIVKTFKNINLPGVDEATIKQNKNDAYNKVLELKSRIAKVKAGAVQEASEVYQTTPQEHIVSSPSITPFSIQQQTAAESFQSSKTILSILDRLVLCENRLAAVDTQNIKLKQQIYELTNLNNKMNERINELELKFTEQINELSHIAAASDVDHHMDNQSLTSLADQELNEISFDGIDFDEMFSDTKQIEQSSRSQTNNMNLNEVELDEIEFDEIGFSATKLDNDGQPEQPSRLEIDFEQINPGLIGVSPNADNGTLDGMFEEITSDDIEYDEITPDAIAYDDNISPDDNLDTYKSNPDFGYEDAHEDEEVKESFAHENRDANKHDSSEDQDVLSSEAVKDADAASTKAGDIYSSGYGEDIPKYLRCFKIENKPIALPDDKIYNIYKIPSKLTRSINQMPIIPLGEFSSFFQNLSKNMKGHLKDVSNATLKKMNVDVHLLTTQVVEYNMAVLCSFEDKVSIIPVTDICDNRTHPMTEIKNGHNDFSEHNVNIVDIGSIPFVALCKK